jgi:uncharacterized membrane protein YkvA (DUF1232 family)
LPKGFVSHCVVLVRRLLGDPRVPRRRKLALGLLVAYLAFPLDLIPDFLPVVGQLDDALVAGLVLRGLARGAGAGLLREHWPGGPEGLALVLRLAGVGADARGLAASAPR